MNHDRMCTFPQHKAEAPHDYCDDCCLVWECQCTFIESIRADERALAAEVDDANVTRDRSAGAHDALTLLAAMAVSAERDGDQAAARTLLAGVAAIAPQVAWPVDPQVAVTLDADALRHVTELLQRDFDAGYWAGDEDDERSVQAILSGWRSAASRDGSTVTVTLPVTLWIAGTELLDWADEAAREVIETVNQVIPVLRSAADPSTAADFEWMVPGLSQLMTLEQTRIWWDSPQHRWNGATPRQMRQRLGPEKLLEAARAIVDGSYS